MIAGLLRKNLSRGWQVFFFSVTLSYSDQRTTKLAEIKGGSFVGELFLNQNSQLVHKSGTCHDVSGKSNPPKRGKGYRAATEVKDIDYSGADAALLNAEAIVDVIREISMDTVLTLNEIGEITVINPRSPEILGYSEEELNGLHISRLLPGIPWQSLFQGKIPLPLRLYEILVVRKDQISFPAEIQLGSYNTGSHPVFTCILRDVREGKRTSKTFDYLPYHDPLTKLPNRSMLFEQIDRHLTSAKSKGQELALLVMNLNHFKDYNDTLGHSIGDRILQHVARCLSNQSQRSITVARLGGDEFAVTARLQDLQQPLETFAEGILNSLEKPFEWGEQSFSINASAGISLFPKHGETLDDLMRCADVALHNAKHSDAKFIVYNPEIDPNSVHRLVLMSELKKALANQKLTLNYQPKMDLRSGKLIGVEALARWHHEKFGFIPPDQFIPLAEHIGLMKTLTLWALQQSLTQCREWQQQGIHLHVAVNISVHNLQDPTFPQEVAGLLEKNEIPAELLVLEITEGSIMADPVRAMEILSSLNQMGIRLSIDDFGTGYSSLGYLKRLPIKELKVDKSFVQGMMDNSNDAIIVHSIIDLAHNLGLQVVAEGVEDAKMEQTLRMLNCDMIQGYFICRPVSGQELTSKIGELSRRASEYMATQGR